MCEKTIFLYTDFDDDSFILGSAVGYQLSTMDQGRYFYQMFSTKYG